MLKLFFFNVDVSINIVIREVPREILTKSVKFCCMKTFLRLFIFTVLLLGDCHLKVISDQ